MSEMKPTRKTRVALLSLVLLLSLTLAFATSALGQGLSDSNETPLTAADTGEQMLSPAATPVPTIDCSKPIPGKTTTLGEDDEILVAYAGQSNNTHITKYDNASKTNANLNQYWSWDYSGAALYQPRTAAITTADLDNDGKAEVIAADASGYGDELGVVSIKNPEVSSGPAYDIWTSDSHDRRGGDMDYMDAAAGNLDGAHGGDASEEVVVAFQDADKGLQLVLFNGESDGGIAFMGWWWSEAHARQDMSDVSVDVGDLNGDGIDNEIVLALSDGYGVLQVIVLEYNGSGGLTELAYSRSIGAYFVDVTTGVFSGDGKDQIAVAIKDGNKDLHARLLEYDSGDKSIKVLSGWADSNHYRGDIQDVSVASGDVDGDKWDEVVIALADTNDQFQAISLDSDPEANTLTVHSSVWGISGATDVSYLSVGAGDIDSDGKAEVVASFSDYDGYLQLLSFDDKSGCPCDDNGDGMQLRDQRQDPFARSTFLAMGDVDGNNLYGDYTGQCEETHEARVIAMANRPPYWADLGDAYSDTNIGYGNSIKGGDEDQDFIATKYGGSVTFDKKFDIGGFSLGSSFTKDWEHSTKQSWTHGSSLETRAGWTEKNDGIVASDDITYYTYQYQKRDGSGLASVSIPVDKTAAGDTMTYWSDGHGQSEYGDSWVPAYSSGWIDDKIIANLVGENSQGAGSDYYDIDGNGKLDYVFAWIDNPDGENTINYRIARDVQADGNPTKGWSDTYKVPDPGANEVGWTTAGLGAAVAKLNGNETPDLVVAWVAGSGFDDDGLGNSSEGNWAAYKIGWDLDANGAASSWSDKITIPNWEGSSTQGVGLDIVDLNHNSKPEMYFGWIGNPSGINAGYYKVAWDLYTNGLSSNWWIYPKPIEGAFGTDDSGLGLTVTDMDGSGRPELVAAWVRDLEGRDEWAYAVSDDLDGNAYVHSWTPGYGVTSWLNSSTQGAALASANLNHGDDLPELVISWIDNLSGANKAWLEVGKVLPFGGEVDQHPTDIKDDDPNDGRFQIRLYNEWWNVNGKVLWRWDQTPDSHGNDLEPIFVKAGGADPYWKVNSATFSKYSSGTSESHNYKVGGELKFLGIEIKGARTWGFSEGHSSTISWEDGLLLDGQSHGLPEDSPESRWYKYAPFTYMVEAMSGTGIKQSYMVLDYIVQPGPFSAEGSAANTTTASLPLAAHGAPGVTPRPPIVASPNHPDPNTWYATDTAVFTWVQPDGDPAVVDGYRWYLDRSPDTVPSGMSFGLTDTTSYEGLSDGLRYLHLQARNEGGEWSETTHHLIRVDTKPPQAKIVLDPPLPDGNDGWYNTPVTIAIGIEDGAGSGVESIEISSDGVTWQPYTDPLMFDTDTPLTTLSARATDIAGHVSEPVSTTIGLDLTLPISVEGPGCWEPGDACMAGVIIDAVGNQRLRLSGPLDASLSGEIGLGILISGDRWAAADEVGEDFWSFTSDSELGAGCHTFEIQGEDRAGNIEPPHAFAEAVVWHPQERPNLSGSILSITPHRVRPGDLVNVALSVPNSGWQETWVPISVLLPTGLDVLPDTISHDGEYDPVSRTITWPPRYLWPGQENRFTFSAHVDDALSATNLNVALTALGTWPIAETCPAEALSGFQDLQTTVELTTMLSVDPDLPDTDILAPASPFLRIEEGAATRLRDVQLHISAGADGSASADAVWMYLREWTLNSESGVWVTTQESGWLPYAPSHPWSLSPGDGVKYLGVWLADDAWNISALEHNSLAFTNLLESSQALPDGQRIQYRFPLYPKELALFNVVAKAGNPDIYAWQPYSGFRPHYLATGADYVNALGFEVERQGMYLLEVKAEGDSRYQLLLSGDIAPSGASSSRSTATNMPKHPLTVSDPLSAGVAVAPTFPALYLPVMTANH